MSGEQYVPFAITDEAIERYPMPARVDYQTSDAYEKAVVLAHGQRQGWIDAQAAEVRALPAREIVLDALGRRWWETQTGEVETRDELTLDERSNVIENASLAPLADAVLALFGQEGQR